MVRCTPLLRRLWRLTWTLLTLLVDTARFLRLCLRFPTALAWLSCWFDWHQALVLVQPATLLHWHRQGFRLLWRWQARAGRPSIPPDLQVLIRRMAQENPTWGQERIANEL